MPRVLAWVASPLPRIGLWWHATVACRRHGGIVSLLWPAVVFVMVRHCLVVVARDCDVEVASHRIVVFGAAVPSGCRVLVRDFGVLAPDGRRGGEDRESPLLFIVASDCNAMVASRRVVGCGA